jgi:hypothetical protein
MITFTPAATTGNGTALPATTFTLQDELRHETRAPAPACACAARPAS